MNLSVGIVGLPNVGKSTLFNALLQKQQALSANYPFATIDPNIGIVPVPDRRLEELAVVVREAEKLSLTPPLVPATVKFVDIAGLVRGAHKGEGLGNKFLSHIREVSVVAHVVRAFEDPDVIREGSSDVESDYDVIRTELKLSDLDTLERARDARRKDAHAKSACEKLISALSAGKNATDVELSNDEIAAISDLDLLSAKPEIIVLNLSEDEYTVENVSKVVDKYANILSLPHDKFIPICAKIESELVELAESEQKEYLEDLGFTESGLARLIQRAYQELGLISFLTAGEKEVRAWTVPLNTRALQAAGVIHTDFEKNFIKAEVVSFDDFVKYGGWRASREEGRVRLEGKEYVVQEGDVVEFKIGR